MKRHDLIRLWLLAEELKFLNARKKHSPETRIALSQRIFQMQSLLEQDLGPMNAIDAHLALEQALARAVQDQGKARQKAAQ